MNFYLKMLHLSQITILNNTTNFIALLEFYLRLLLGNGYIVVQKESHILTEFNNSFIPYFV